MELEIVVELPGRIKSVLVVVMGVCLGCEIGESVGVVNNGDVFHGGCDAGVGEGEGIAC